MTYNVVIMLYKRTRHKNYCIFKCMRRNPAFFFLWFENRYRVMNACFFFQSKQKARFSAQKGEKSYRNTAWIKNIGDYAESQYARLTVGVIPRCQYTKHFSESWANSVWTVWFENQVQLSFKSLVNCHPNIWGSQFISTRIRFWKLSSIFPSGN